MGESLWLLCIFVWIGLCSFIAFLYRIKSILFKENSEIAKTKFNAIIMASMAGAVFGTGLCLFVYPLIFFIFHFFFPEWENNTDDHFLGWIDFKTSLIVTYLSCVFVSGNMWLLSQKKIIIKKDGDWKA